MKALIVLVSIVLAAQLPLAAAFVCFGKLDITLGKEDLADYGYSLNGIGMKKQPYVRISTKAGDATIYPFLFGIDEYTRNTCPSIIAFGKDIFSLGPYQINKNFVKTENVGKVNELTFELQEERDFSFEFEYITVKSKYGERRYSRISEFENSDTYKQMKEESFSNYRRLNYGYDGGDVVVNLYYKLNKTCPEYADLTFDAYLNYKAAYNTSDSYRSSKYIFLEEGQAELEVCVSIIFKIDDMLWTIDSFSTSERVSGVKYVFAK